MGRDPGGAQAEGDLVGTGEQIPDLARDRVRIPEEHQEPGRSGGAKKGNVEAALAQGSKTFEATYLWPFQNHGMMGPSCAVADVQGDKVTVWAGSQGTFGTRKQVADLLGIPEKNVRVIYRESSGCYGRLSPDDVPLDAALMSRAVGKPVRVQWMRDDEHGWEPKGPAHT